MSYMSTIETMFNRIMIENGVISEHITLTEHNYVKLVELFVNIVGARQPCVGYARYYALQLIIFDETRYSHIENLSDTKELVSSWLIDDEPQVKLAKITAALIMAVVHDNTMTDIEWFYLVLIGHAMFQIKNVNTAVLCVAAIRAFMFIAKHKFENGATLQRGYWFMPEIVKQFKPVDFIEADPQTLSNNLDLLYSLITVTD